MARTKSDRKLFPKAESPLDQVKVQSFKMSDNEKLAIVTTAKSMKMSQRMLIMSAIVEYIDNHPELITPDEESEKSTGSFDSGFSSAFA